MEIQVNCTENNEEYNIIKIAEGMKQAKEIAIEKYYNKETATIKEGVTENTTNLEGIVVSVNEYSEYKFLIGESCEIIGVLEGKVTNTTNIEEFMDLETFETSAFGSEVTETSSIKFSYELESYENNKFKILIKVTDENGIDTIKFPDGDIQKCNGKVEIAIDYEVDEGVDYRFITRDSKGIEKTEVINLIKPVEPIIPNIEIGYPVFTLTGVNSQKVEITYDERKDFLNYYSVNNGETWNLYTGPITTTSKVLKAKSELKRCPQIYTEVSATMNVPTDALSNICYDGKTDKYQEGVSFWANQAVQQLKCYVDSSTWGAKVRASMAQGDDNIARSIFLRFYDSNDELLDEVIQGCYHTNQMWEIESIVPSGTEYVIFFAESKLRVYEFEIIKE